MILDKVNIKNYRQYKDVEIDFSKEPTKNFTIIQGNNGTGKTTLLNALSWCLYGSEIHDYGDDAAMSICNNKTSNIAENGEDIKVSVRIQFIDADDEEIIFHRVKGFRKNNNKLTSNPKLNKFEVITQDGFDYNIKEDDYYTIERKIPKDIEDYFFFDGARLSEYFQNTHNNQIKNAVYNLYQLNLLENVNDNLDKVKNGYIKKQKEISPKIGKVNEDINLLEKDLNDTKKKLEESEIKKREIEKEIESIDEKLIDKKSADLERDVVRNRKLDKKIQLNDKKLDKLKDNHKKFILTNYPYILSYNFFTNFLKIGEENREKGYIPPKFKKSFIEDLLNEGTCICGADLKDGSENRKILEELLNKTNPLSDNAEEISVALIQIKNIIKDIKEFKLTSKNFYKDINGIENENGELLEQHKEVNARLDANPIEEVRKLKKFRNDLVEEKKNCISTIENSKSKIQRLNKNLGDKRKLLNNEKKLEKDLKIYENKIKFCKKSSKAANNLYKDLKEKMRLKVQKLTKEKFIKLQWKQEFKDIIINENYELFIENNLGEYERPGDLSDGEKLCLGLCFMSALHNISGFDLPIIMDTPLGVLDVDMKHNIAKFLPEFVEGKQTILLVTGTEYSDDFRDTLINFIGKEYKIEWKSTSEGKESKVVLNE